MAGFLMAISVAKRLEFAHEEFHSYYSTTSTLGADIKAGDKKGKTRLAYSLRWLVASLECQMNWLESYKARKDTSMTLVYNLVTQQDSATMIQDSASMRAIAILTMVFLPGTFTSVSLLHQRQCARS